ncbi:hypothetical protein ASPWEDRAFT_182694 [Aspergillus wentii DTO 134E9]|uniref:Uncharacterized protein n=1 Tax=Aspergillus wentii DTO 134E9 TaxID=1073089 RepID=A0A1L9RSG5_ASPWE|nr:uncharacterized protein ASPWEDRAFT_182694 [Aspergillus wentii DTO 134E9]KAI9930722.1 hypothetical protein MW887_011478 [Aspergillus wentii]OJJ37891.1 hypothetical protein ASPWEDRAFT_182694 [Aspergillus wentii DTO 134E9]
MASLIYYSLPGFGEKCRVEYGFSDSCIIGDRIVTTGQTGMNPLTLKTSSNFDEEVSQAFSNMNDLIMHALKKANIWSDSEQHTGWDHVVKIRAFIVGLSNIREEARNQMVENIRKWCPRHQPLFTMVGIESLPFPEHHVEIEVDAFIR